MKQNIFFSCLNQVDGSDKVASVVAITRAIFLSPRTAFVTSAFSSKSMCAKKCLQFSTKYAYHMFHRAVGNNIKGSLISESFSLGLLSPEMILNHQCPEHIFFRTVIWHISLEMEKLSEIKLH